MTSAEARRRESALQRCREAAHRQALATAQLHEAIKEAVSVASQRQIGEAVGLSATRVNQIVHGRSR